MLGIELLACDFDVDLKDDGGREFVPKLRENADTRSGSEHRSTPAFNETESSSSWTVPTGKM